MQKGILYLVPTPIGNLKDITYRAVEILKEVHLIACEDTRTSLKLLNHYQIKNRLISYHKFNEKKQTPVLLKELINGNDIAMITDAGTPAISDPASILVKSALQQDIKVSCLPGASACITALAASGLDTESFVFYGFLSPRSKERQSQIHAIAASPHTVIIYESTHNITKTIAELAAAIPDRKAVLARELSKIHETYVRETLANMTADSELETRGEMVLLIEGMKPEQLTDDELRDIIGKADIHSASLNTLSETLAKETGVSKNHLKKLILERKQKGEN